MTERDPVIDSFVLRFVQTGEVAGDQRVRGSVQHLQTGEGIQFSNWHELQNFLGKFLPPAWIPNHETKIEDRKSKIEDQESNDSD